MTSGARDQHDAELYQAIGVAVSNWTAVDQALLRVFAVFIAPPATSDEPADSRVPSIGSAILGAVGFAERIAIIGAVIKAAANSGRIGPDATGSWFAEAGRLLGLLENREALLRGSVVRRLDEDGRVERVVLRYCEFARGELVELMHNDVQLLGGRFLRAAKRLNGFANILLSDRLNSELQKGVVGREAPAAASSRHCEP